MGRIGDLREPYDREPDHQGVRYPANTDLALDGDKPVLKRRKGAERRPSAITLEHAIHQRCPEHSLLDVLTRTAYLTEWHRHFGPAFGSDPKIRDTLSRWARELVDLAELRGFG